MVQVFDSVMLVVILERAFALLSPVLEVLVISSTHTYLGKPYM